MKLIECVPNFSEGRRPEVVAAIRDAIAAVAGVHVLDASSDASHNRSVITFVAPIDVVVDAAFAGIREAQRADRPHARTRASTRAWAPPTSCPSSRSKARRWRTASRSRASSASASGASSSIPVFLYERAATRPIARISPTSAAASSRGCATTSARRPQRTPDFGPSAVHSTAGAVAIGARPFLVAYNVYLGPAYNLPVAKEVAKAVRGSSGGLRYVKAMGFEVDGQAQVSMNLVDTEKTPLHVAFDMVRTEAEARGVTPTWSEIVGLVPERALFDAAARHIRLRNFTQRDGARAQGARGHHAAANRSADSSPRSRRRRRCRAAAAWRRTPARSAPRSRRWSPASPSARRSTPRSTPRCASSRVRAAALGNTLGALVARDAEAYAAVAAAYKLPAETPELEAEKKAKIDEALLPPPTFRWRRRAACADVAELALAVAERGNTQRGERRGRRRAARRSGLHRARATTCASTSSRSATVPSAPRSSWKHASWS